MAEKIVLRRKNNHRMPSKMTPKNREESEWVEKNR